MVLRRMPIKYKIQTNKLLILLHDTRPPRKLNVFQKAKISLNQACATYLAFERFIDTDANLKKGIIQDLILF